MRYDPDLYDFVMTPTLLGEPDSDKKATMFDSDASVRGFCFKVNPKIPFVIFMKDQTPTTEHLENVAVFGQKSVIAEGYLTPEVIFSHRMLLVAVVASI